jgi:hypothetical protein
LIFARYAISSPISFAAQATICYQSCTLLRSSRFWRFSLIGPYCHCIKK